ncbi:MAG: hypothetical protein ACQES9_12655 [Myxococcota bacterium]
MLQKAVFLICLLISTRSIAGKTTVGKGPLPSQTESGIATSILTKIPGKTAKIGSWIEYSLFDKQKQKKLKLKIAFVGRADGGRSSWIEISISGMNQVIRVKMLFEGNPGAKIKNPKKAIIKMGHLYPMSLPLPKTKKMLPMIYRQPMMKPVILSPRTIKTPAGEFKRATGARGMDPNGNVVEVYNHKNIRLNGFLKFEDSRFKMVLIGQGKGARSRIKQKPAPFSVPH